MARPKFAKLRPVKAGPTRLGANSTNFDSMRSGLDHICGNSTKLRPVSANCGVASTCNSGACGTVEQRGAAS